MKTFENSIILDESYLKIILIKFKCINDLPLIFDLNNQLYDEIAYLNEGKDSNIIIYGNKEKDIKIIKNIFNISVSFEYISCILEESESIEVKVNEYEFNLTKSYYKNLLSNMKNDEGDIYHFFINYR